jgi:hypothetical protein
VKTIRNVIFLLMLFLPAANCLKAQVNTFSFLYESPQNKSSFTPIQDSDNCYIVPISLFTGTTWAPSDLDKAFLLKFSPTGDTSGYYYSIPDTTFSFTNIISTSDGGYLVAGSSKALGMDSVNLLLMKLNNALEVDWQKHHYMYGNWSMAISRLFQLDDNDYMIAGHVCMFPCATTYPYLVRIDQNGNIVRETIYNFFSGFKYDYMLNSAKNRIWMFARGLPPNSNGLSVTILDTTFAYLSSHLLQHLGGNPLYAKWLNDTSFIFSYQSKLQGSPYDDKEFTIEIRDTLFNLLQYSQFGLPDSYDCPGWLKGLDFRYPDTIFYAANTGLPFGPPPQGYTNLFMVRQTDGQLKERYRHFYGGDSFYLVDHIIATSDGGCFVGARKFNYDTGNFELLFLKLNSEGLLVGTNDPDIYQRMSLLYPNPAHDQIIIEAYLPDISISISDLGGRPVRLQKGLRGKTTVDVSELQAGVYIVSVYSGDQFIESHKFVKQ